MRTHSIVGLASGILFGFGLAVSDMLSPARAMGFFDLTGSWDPTLLFVMMGAVIVSVIGHMLLKKRKKPFFAEKWNFPWEKKGTLDKKLVIGSVLFGVGWGISGLCPGPAMGNIIFLNPFVLTFLFSMITTMGIYKWSQNNTSVIS